MQLQKISVTLGILFLTVAVARADKVTFDYDHSVNFYKYKNFMWLHDEPQTTEPFMKDRIMAAVDAQLTLRGLRRVSEGADLAVGAKFATEEKHSWETYYSGSDGGWATTTEKTYEVGTLTVDLFDVHSEKLVWEAVATDTLSRRPKKRWKESDEQVAKMFKNFPPGFGTESTSAAAGLSRSNN